MKTAITVKKGIAFVRSVSTNGRAVARKFRINVPDAIRIGGTVY